MGDQHRDGRDTAQAVEGGVAPVLRRDTWPARVQRDAGGREPVGFGSTQPWHAITLHLREWPADPPNGSADR